MYYYDNFYGLHGQNECFCGISKRMRLEEEDLDNMCTKINEF